MPEPMQVSPGPHRAASIIPARSVGTAGREAARGETGALEPDVRGDLASAPHSVATFTPPRRRSSRACAAWCQIASCRRRGRRPARRNLRRAASDTIHAREQAAITLHVVEGECGWIASTHVQVMPRRGAGVEIESERCTCLAIF